MAGSNWLKIDSGLIDNPKFWQFADMLGVDLAKAAGHLLFLWGWGQRLAPDGILRNVNAYSIARGAAWDGDPQKFMDALLNCSPREDKHGFLEVVSEGYKFHDWDEYGGALDKTRKKWVEYKARKKKEFETQDKPQSIPMEFHDNSTRIPEEFHENSSGTPVEFHAKIRQDKSRLEKNRQEEIRQEKNKRGVGEEGETTKSQCDYENHECDFERENIDRDFEEFWNIYPRKDSKAYALKNYKASRNKGFTREELLVACKNYADHCRAERLEKRHTLLGSTFLGPNERWSDYAGNSKTANLCEFDKDMAFFGDHDD